MKLIKMNTLGFQSYIICRSFPNYFSGSQCSIYIMLSETDVSLKAKVDGLGLVEHHRRMGLGWESPLGIGSIS